MLSRCSRVFSFEYIYALKTSQVLVFCQCSTDKDGSFMETCLSSSWVVRAISGEDFLYLLGFARSPAQQGALLPLLRAPESNPGWVWVARDTWTSPGPSHRPEQSSLGQVPKGTQGPWPAQPGVLPQRRVQHSVSLTGVRVITRKESWLSFNIFFHNFLWNVLRRKSE